MQLQQIDLIDKIPDHLQGSLIEHVRRTVPRGLRRGVESMIQGVLSDLEDSHIVALSSAIDATLETDSKRLLEAKAIHQLVNSLPDNSKSTFYKLAEKAITRKKRKQKPKFNLDAEINSKVEAWGEPLCEDHDINHQLAEAKKQLLEYYAQDLDSAQLKNIIFQAIYNPSQDRNDVNFHILQALYKTLSRSNLNVSTDNGANNYPINDLLIRNQDVSVQIGSLVDSIQIPEMVSSNAKIAGIIKSHNLDVEVQDLSVKLRQSNGSRSKALDEINNGARIDLSNILEDIDQAEEFKIRMLYVGKFLEALLRNPFIKDLEEASLIDLIEVSSKLALDPNYNFVITTVFGGTEDELNARVPSYVLAGVNALEEVISIQNELREKGFTSRPPTFRVVSAYNSAVVVNGMDESTASKRASEILGLCESYIANFHPEILDNVDFSTDDKALYETDEMKQLEALVCEDLRAQIGDVIHLLEKMGERHGGEEGKCQALRYAALHPLVLLDVIPSSILENPDAVISIGGKPEKIFNKVRKAISTALSSNPAFFNPKMIRTISKSGETPVYYVDENDKELTVEDVVEGRIGKKFKGLSKSTLADLSLIKADIAKARGISANNAWFEYTRFLEQL